MTEKRISESDLILPALFVIDARPDVTTTQLIEFLQEVLKPTGEDAKILKSRNDTKFSQKVRNLVSHNTFNRNGFATYTDGKFTITETGKEVLAANRDAIEY